jgi:hypothetical protein
MKTSKTSWHHDLYFGESADHYRRNPGYRPDVSLCQYFWNVVAKLICIVGISLLPGLVLFILIGVFQENAFVMLAITTGLVTLILAGLGAMGTRKILDKYDHSGTVECPAVTSFFELLGAYAVALKHKVCPLLEFV